MTVKKLTEMPYAQAEVVINNSGSTYLVSYTTTVAEIDKDGWFSVNGLYSMTTRKHLSAFAKEYVNKNCDFQTIKYLALNDSKMNIYTGEIKDN